MNCLFVGVALRVASEDAGDEFGEQPVSEDDLTNIDVDIGRWGGVPVPGAMEMDVGQDNARIVNRFGAAAIRNPADEGFVVEAISFDDVGKAAAQVNFRRASDAELDGIALANGTGSARVGITTVTGMNGGGIAEAFVVTEHGVNARTLIFAAGFMGAGDNMVRKRNGHGAVVDDDLAAAFVERRSLCEDD